MTAIAVPIFVKAGADLEELIAGAEAALEGTAGIIELRCDTATPKMMLEAIELARVPVIVTVRPKWEGGFSEKSDEQRTGLWEAAMEAGADYLDVELVTWEKSGKVRTAVGEMADKSGTRLILSNHCFDGRPGDLPKRFERLRAVKQADILKLVWKAESILDAVEALKLTAVGAKKGGRQTVALAMGEEGLISRLLARKFGAPFTFASAETGKESAPGQPTVRDLRSIYRWEKQQADSPVYGVVGWPVGHSLSPHIHNAGLEAAGLPGAYVPLAVRPEFEAFAAIVDGLRAIADLRGLSVTIPHKENAFRYAQERKATIGGLSQRLGALNTLVWRGNQLAGLNSDYAGALDALVRAWSGKRTDVAGKRVAVLGAGGASRAIVAGLAAHGATVVIYNRTRAKADALAAEMASVAKDGGKVVAADWEKICDSCCEAYINCTPLGMHPKVDGSPIDFDPAWTADTVVFDTVYNPPLTKLLKLAQKKRAKIVPGTEMFVRQAAVQFREFTGRDADVALFRSVLSKAR